MSKPYIVSNWYWIVGDDETQIYSSAMRGFVPAATDAGYLAWLDEGGRPTRIASLDDLREVLVTQYPAGWALTFPEQQLAKTAEINAACSAAIVGGFASNALGAPHTYDSALEDQLNLIGAVGLGIDLPYRCADEAGVKAFRLHTAAQLKQVAADGAAIKLSALEKAATLKAQVQAAEDAAAVEAVVW